MPEAVLELGASELTNGPVRASVGPECAPKGDTWVATFIGEELKIGARIRESDERIWDRRHPARATDDNDLPDVLRIAIRKGRGSHQILRLAVSGLEGRVSGASWRRGEGTGRGTSER